MPRRDQLERQRQQPGAVVLVEGCGPAIADPPENCLEFRQVVGADEAELLEERVVRRQVGEQLDHGLGDLLAGLDQVLGQTDLVEHLPHISVVGEGVELERRADRGSEQQVFGDRGVGVEALGVVGLDEVGDAVLDEPPGERAARLEQAARPPADRPRDRAASAARAHRRRCS